MNSDQFPCVMSSEALACGGLKTLIEKMKQSGFCIGHNLYLKWLYLILWMHLALKIPGCALAELRRRVLSLNPDRFISPHPMWASLPGWSELTASALTAFTNREEKVMLLLCPVHFWLHHICSCHLWAKLLFVASHVYNVKRKAPSWAQRAQICTVSVSMEGVGFLMRPSIGNIRH